MASEEADPLAAEIVEVPIPRKPLKSKNERVEEAEFVITKGFPVWFVWSFKVKRFAVVEVAPTVTTYLESGVVVPIERLSVWVVRWTRVPESVKPGLPPEHAAQVRSPAPSLFKQVLADWEEGQV